MQRLAGRVALVTGASRGIGAAVAKCFAAEGAHVVLVARTVGGLEAVDDEIQAAGGTTTLVPLDVAQFEQIDRLGAALYERYGRLDILVGNAGTLGVLSPLGHIDPAVWQEVMAVNLTANWRLIRSMDLLLKRAEAGRAIFVTSGAASGALPYWGAYAASKAALETMVRVYAGEVANISRLRVNLLDPGTVRTALRAQAFPGENPADLAAPEDVAAAFVELAAPECQRNGELVRLY
jgi:NAD(P)-dependent dehydrogenase (short-subunit alcohol dehydrogenase family)